MGQANSKSPFSINDLREFEDLVEKEGTKLHAKNSKKGQVAGEEIQAAFVKFQEQIGKVLSRDKARVQIQPSKEAIPEDQPILFQPQESEFELVQRFNELQRKLELSISEIQSLKDVNQQQKQEIERFKKELQQERRDRQSLIAQNQRQKESIEKLNSQFDSQRIEILSLQKSEQELRTIQNQNRRIEEKCKQC